MYLGRMCWVLLGWLVLRVSWANCHLVLASHLRRMANSIHRLLRRRSFVLRTPPRHACGGGLGMLASGLGVRVGVTSSFLPRDWPKILEVEVQDA
jgi:hypothetical protein